MANTQAPKMANVRQVVETLQEKEPGELGQDFIQYVREYARENPETACLWCFGIGFVLGWKLKLW